MIIVNKIQCKSKINVTPIKVMQSPASSPRVGICERNIAVKVVVTTELVIMIAIDGPMGPLT